MEKRLLKENYKDYKLYSFQEKYLPISKKIIEKEYTVLEEYKNDNRTYVAKIEIEGRIYLLKMPFFKRKIKKIISIFKKGESLESLINLKKGREKGLAELVEVYCAGVLRKNNLIEKEFFLMEYFDGKVHLDDYHCNKIIKLVNKIHYLGFYHGDCNPYNFLFDKEDDIKIIDTKCKKMLFGNYKAHYDIITMRKHLKRKIYHPYKKNIFYWLAILIKKTR